MNGGESLSAASLLVIFLGSLSTGVDGGFMWNFVHLRTGFLFFNLILNSI
ncbi:hypothetical protein N624_1263 [Levilactobacillus brevis]|nr:hypothetical protein N624_1263 [Levilactobacillus brevis]KIP00425.1 hypothetical protein N627_0843 [Levilactobacillus brevis]